jgi:hypothetical protein
MLFRQAPMHTGLTIIWNSTTIAGDLALTAMMAGAFLAAKGIIHSLRAYRLLLGSPILSDDRRNNRVQLGFYRLGAGSSRIYHRGCAASFAKQIIELKARFEIACIFNISSFMTKSLPTSKARSPSRYKLNKSEPVGAV